MDNETKTAQTPEQMATQTVEKTPEQNPEQVTTQMPDDKNMNFMLSAEGQEVVKESGHFPVKG